jgi:integrase
MALTELKLKNLSSADAGRKLRDSENCTGKVRVGVDGSISVYFSYRYRFDGDQPKDATLGTWPKSSLTAIRIKLFELKAQIEAGIDPVEQKREQREQQRIAAEARAKVRAAREETNKQLGTMHPTFGDLFKDWLAHGTISKSKDKLTRTVEIHLFPHFELRPVASLDEPDYLPVLQAIACKSGNDRKGMKSTALKLFSLIRRMYLWALGRHAWRNVVTFSPLAATLPHLVTGQYFRKFRTRALQPFEVQLLPQKIAATHVLADPAVWGRARMTPLQPENEHGIWVVLGTMVRVGELCGSKRSYIDFKRRQWRLPSSLTKTENEHIVYLSDFVIEHLQALFALVDSPWVIPHPEDATRPMPPELFSKRIGDRQTPKGRRVIKTRQSPTWTSLEVPGGRWTVHDLRRTGATFMQSMHTLPDVIERCLNHVQENDIRRTYQTYAYENEKRDAWLMLGQYLDQLMNRRRPVEPLAEPIVEDWEVLPALHRKGRMPVRSVPEASRAANLIG